MIAGDMTVGEDRSASGGIDRAALWLHLATEDAVRAASAGDRAAARRRLEMARRVAGAFALTGVMTQRHVDEWSDDVDLAMAVRGCADLSVPPWWSRPSAQVRAETAGADEKASAEAGQDGRRQPAVSAYVRWLASALLAGWPRPLADASAVMREAADAFRYVGVVDEGLDVELQTAVDAVAARRFPAGWPAPPRSIGTRTGRTDLDGALTTPTGRHRLSAVEGAPDSWVAELLRDDGFLPVGQPVWAVDDRRGLYFGTVEGATDGEPRLRFQPGLQAAASEVEVLIGVLPEPARVAMAVSSLRAAL